MPADVRDPAALARFETTTDDYAANGLLRVRRPLTPQAAARVLADGRTCINFCSNDYLGLAADKRIAAALQEGADRYGVGAGASQLISGYTSVQAALEERLAEFCGYGRALVFSSGYLANLGALTAFADRQTGVHVDRLAHASLIDATLLSRARLQRYAHNDTEALARALSADPRAKKIVVTEGVFSMEGDNASLPAIADQCVPSQALLYLDDAHGFGVRGDHGRGSVSQQGLDSNAVPIMMATFGKALGVSGAFVAGSPALLETVLQKARSLIYTTAPSPALMAAVMCALTLVETEQWRRDKLQELIAYWRDGAERRGLPLLVSDNAIQPLLIGDNERALAISEGLRKQGLLISAIRPPTVPEGSARLRITLTAAHDRQDVDTLLAALTALLT